MFSNRSNIGLAARTWIPSILPPARITSAARTSIQAQSHLLLRMESEHKWTVAVATSRDTTRTPGNGSCPLRRRNDVHTEVQHQAILVRIWQLCSGLHFVVCPLMQLEMMDWSLPRACARDRQVQICSCPIVSQGLKSQLLNIVPAGYQRTTPMIVIYAIHACFGALPVVVSGSRSPSE